MHFYEEKHKNVLNHYFNQNWENAVEDTQTQDFDNEILMILKAHYAQHTFSSVEKDTLFNHLLQTTQ